MGAAFSLFVIAIGAICRYAITDNVNGIDITTVGTILIVCGVIGLILSVIKMVMDSERQGPGSGPPRQQ